MEKNGSLSPSQRIAKISMLSQVGRQMLLGRIKAQNKKASKQEIHRLYVLQVLGEKLGEEFLLRGK